MKRALSGILMLCAVLSPAASFAGWGAIACDVRGSGACGVSYGWANPGYANWRAINACRAGGYDCYIFNWEHNMCIHGPNSSWACN